MWQRQTQQTAPVLHHQHNVLQIQAFNQLYQHLPVPAEGVKSLFFWLVAFAKADQIWRHHPRPAFQKSRHHLAVQIAPGRVTVQAQVGGLRCIRICILPAPHSSLIQIMQSQPGQTRQIAHIMRWPRVAGHIVKSGIRCSQCIAVQGVVHFGLQLVLSTFGFEKALQLCCAGVSQHAAFNHGLVVQRVDERVVVKEVGDRACRARFGIYRTENHALQPRMQHRTGAHGAGLQRYKKLATVESVIAQRFCCRT